MKRMSPRWMLNVLSFKRSLREPSHVKLIPGILRMKRMSPRWLLNKYNEVFVCLRHICLRVGGGLLDRATSSSLFI